MYVFVICTPCFLLETDCTDDVRHRVSRQHDHSNTYHHLLHRYRTRLVFDQKQKIRCIYRTRSFRCCVGCVKLGARVIVMVVSQTCLFSMMTMMMIG